MAWLVRCGLSDRPTTATVLDSRRRSRISSSTGFSKVSPPWYPPAVCHRYEGVFFTFRFHHDVRFTAVQGFPQRVPVAEVYRVGVCAGLLLGVLAGDVELRTRSPNVPRRYREVQGFSQCQAGGVQVVVEGVGDRRYPECGRRLRDFGDRPDPLVVLQREVGERLFLRAHDFHEPPRGSGFVLIRAAHVQHYNAIRAAHQREDAGHVAKFHLATPGDLRFRAAGVDVLAGVHREPDAQRTGQFSRFSKLVAALGLPVVRKIRVGREGDQALSHPE